jgi:YebC/PmpR family DNA-binding regulatory protein
MGRSFENRKASIFKTAAQKSKLYAKYGKQLYVVAKNGLPDPDANPPLRSLIEKAKRDQVPAHVIEKAVEKARGGAGEDFAPARYEGFGPGSCSVIVDCLTDNPNRTISDVRNCFTKTGSKLGTAGSVAHLFEHLAVLSFKGENEEQALEAMLEAGIEVDDIECKEGSITIFTPPGQFYLARSAILAAFPGTEFDVQEITFLPQATTEISAEDAPMFEKFIQMLNDCDDVQEVYHNAVLPSST